MTPGQMTDVILGTTMPSRWSLRRPSWWRMGVTGQGPRDHSSIMPAVTEESVTTGVMVEDDEARKAGKFSLAAIK